MATFERRPLREVLGDLAQSRKLVVINDEAHHAWRVPADAKLQGVRKEDLFVYGGGFTEWCTNGLPVEVGARKSGQLLDHKK